MFWALELLLLVVLESVKTSSGGCSNGGVICGSRKEMVVVTLLLSNESRNLRKSGVGIDAKTTSDSASARSGARGVGGVEVYYQLLMLKLLEPIRCWLHKIGKRE